MVPMADTLEYNEELIKTENEEKKVPYQRRWGDRVDGRRLRSGTMLRYRYEQRFHQRKP